MTFPVHRPRRLRRTPEIRALVRETTLRPEQLVAPLFCTLGEGRRKPIGSMPGHAQLSTDLEAQGRRVQEFEESLAAYTGARHAIVVSNCTTALHLSLIAAGVRPGDEVICPSLTFIATANAILHAGATPIFVDIDPRTYNVTAEIVEAAITPKTAAISSLVNPSWNRSLMLLTNTIDGLRQRRGMSSTSLWQVTPKPGPLVWGSPSFW